MKWLSLALALVQLTQWIIRKVEKQKFITEGEARQLNRSIKLANKRIERAIQGRKLALDQHNADGVQDDDPFLRD